MSPSHSVVLNSIDIPMKHICCHGTAITSKSPAETNLSERFGIEPTAQKRPLTKNLCCSNVSFFFFQKIFFCIRYTNPLLFHSPFLYPSIVPSSHAISLLPFSPSLSASSSLLTLVVHFSFTLSLHLYFRLSNVSAGVLLLSLSLSPSLSPSPCISPFPLQHISLSFTLSQFN